MNILLVGLSDRESVLYCSWLSEFGHNCKCVINQSEAYRIISSQLSFDVCICNVDVSDLDGFYLKRKLNTEGNRLPVIFISDRIMEDSDLLLKGLAAIRFISRPKQSSELLDVVDKAELFARHIRLKPEYLNPIAKLSLCLDGKKVEPDFLLSTSYAIGRSDQSDIRVYNSSCSREQAIVQRIYDERSHSNSHYSIVDYSRNGIKVNGKKITAFKELRNGDLIQFPGFEATYSLLSNSQPTDPRATLT